MGTVKVLVRSNCIFSDSVLVGDHLLALGFADESKFDFVMRGHPVATTGTVAYRTPGSYLIDKEIFGGMSGGIVFKEYPAVGQYAYRAVGIVSASLSKHREYSWITTLDYVDSILTAETGNAWGGKQLNR